MAWDDNKPNPANQVTTDVTAIYGNLQYLYDMHTIMNLGHKRGLRLSYKDGDEFYVDCGSIYIDDGSNKVIYGCTEQLTKQVTSLSASTWYSVYIDPPASGTTLVSADIEYSTTAPTFDQTKGGYYHPTTTDWRCIGFFCSDASATPLIRPFTVDGQIYRYNDWMASIFDNTSAPSSPSNTFTDVTAVQPLASFPTLVSVTVSYRNATAYLCARKNGTSGTGLVVGYCDSAGPTTIGEYFIPTDTSKKFEIAFSTACSNYVIIRQQGFLIPDSIA